MVDGLEWMAPNLKDYHVDSVKKFHIVNEGFKCLSGSTKVKLCQGDNTYREVQSVGSVVKTTSSNLLIT